MRQTCVGLFLKPIQNSNMIGLLISCVLLGLASARPMEQEPVFGWSVEPYIVGGSNVAISSHPHQVSLQTSTGAHSCGASIIGTTKLVCAAHCTQGNSGSYRIRAGSSAYNSGGQTRTISRFVNHPNYSATAGYPNDISTIHLSSALTFGSTVGSINLASGSNSYVGVTATITGWGRTSGSSGIPINLQGVTIPVISNTECQSRMVNIRTSHICVFQAGRGACSGDSGGPMRTGSTLIGVTSWGEATCSTNYPSVYSRVTSFYTWINSN